ncbi:glycosyltransferase family 39 protein [Kocuria sp. CPCC 205268]|uniref:glycosyltransferase family 39 protein n=1 Tax=Kocuria oxytropis TaxID=3058913 RepID=UPI0034D527C6
MSTSQIIRPLHPPPAAPRAAPATGHAGTRAAQWIQRLAVPLLVLLQVLLSLRLGNTAFEDEALYVQAGRDLLDHLRTGAEVEDYGFYFSGAPLAYPLLAGLLDELGGLALVRAFSLACVVVAMLCVRATARHLFGRTAGDLAALAFAVTGPVVFVSALATFDALCLLLLALALYLGVTRRSYPSAAVAGLALAAAAVVKYTGAAFIPVVLLAVLFTARPRRSGRQVIRVLTTAAVAAAALGVLWARAGAEVRAGVEFTTTSREALAPASASHLVDLALQDIGLLTALALVGGFFVVRSWRSALLLLALLAGAFGLVLSQLHLGESVSFEKHMAYSALFLAPLAGQALAGLAGPGMRGVVLAVLVVVLLATGLVRAQALYQWPSVAPVVELVESQDPQPGRYFATHPLPLKYHLWNEHPDLQWTAPGDLAADDPQALRQAVADGTYRMIIWSADVSGNPALEPQVQVLSEAVANSPDYELVSAPPTVPAWGSTAEWYVYALTD